MSWNKMNGKVRQAPSAFAALTFAAVLAGPALKADVIPGSVTLNANRTSVNIASWVYDTGNGLPASIITPDQAQTLGLGSFNAATGVFTPNGTVAPTVVLANKNHLAFYSFPGAIVTGIDSKKNSCPATIPIAVVTARGATMVPDPAKPGMMILAGDGNSAFLNQDILNQAWIRQVMGASFGAGATAVYRWPIDPTKLGAIQSTNNAVAVADSTTGVTQQVVQAQVLGSNGNALAAGMVYNSASNLTFLTQAQANALHLAVTGQVDLSVMDPATLAAINLAQQNPLGETVFDAVSLSSIDLFRTGSPSDLLTSSTGEALVLPSGDSDFGVLGADFVGSLGQRVSYFPGAGSSGNDLFVLTAAPEPAAYLQLAFGGLFAVLCGVTSRRRSARIRM